eukprot:scaffold135452_cov32-Tisochrysis_lutea.AAC.5
MQPIDCRHCWGAHAPLAIGWRRWPEERDWRHGQRAHSCLVAPAAGRELKTRGAPCCAASSIGNGIVQWRPT